MSENTPKDPNDISPDAAKRPETGDDDTNPLGDLLNQVSARAEEKRAEITDQLRTQEADRARKEREDTEKRRQDLLRKREKAIKKRQTQMLNAPKGNGSTESQKDAEPTQVPVADFDLTLKNATPTWVWVALALVVLGGGGIFLSLQTDTESTASPPLSPDSPGEQLVEEPPAEEQAPAAAVAPSPLPQAIPDATTATPDGGQMANTEDADPNQAAVKAEAPAKNKKAVQRNKRKARKTSSKRNEAKKDDTPEPVKKKGSIGLKRGLFRSNIK